MRTVIYDMILYQPNLYRVFMSVIFRNMLPYTLWSIINYLGAMCVDVYSESAYDTSFCCLFHI